MTKFINTTPHLITLKCSDGILEIKPTDDKAVVSLFRGITTVNKKEQLLTDQGYISITGSPIYNIDTKEFDKLITEASETTIYLISTISGEMLKGSSVSIPKNVLFMVPYSGPNQEKCLRENGQIKWVSELMDYTN